MVMVMMCVVVMSPAGDTVFLWAGLAGGVQLQGGGADAVRAQDTAHLLFERVGRGITD